MKQTVETKTTEVKMEKKKILVESHRIIPDGIVHHAA